MALEIFTESVTLGPVSKTIEITYIEPITYPKQLNIKNINVEPTIVSPGTVLTISFDVNWDKPLETTAELHVVITLSAGGKTAKLVDDKKPVSEGTTGVKVVTQPKVPDLHLEPGKYTATLTISVELIISAGGAAHPPGIHPT